MDVGSSSIESCAPRAAAVPFNLGARTMVELLSAKVVDHPDRVAFVYLDDRDGVTELTFAQLDRKARAIAARLQLELKPGDRALLVYPAGLEFIAAFSVACTPA